MFMKISFPDHRLLVAAGPVQVQDTRNPGWFLGSPWTIPV
jgi:hypothetical protein